MNKITSTENVRLDFVYDASATLIGVNTVEGHYFYIRDITGNILGLIDNEGNYKVKYKYVACKKYLRRRYSNHVSHQDTILLSIKDTS